MRIVLFCVTFLLRFSIYFLVFWGFFFYKNAFFFFLYVSRFIRRLIYFFKPTNHLFSRFESEHEQEKKIATVGCQMVDFLVRCDQVRKLKKSFIYPFALAEHWHLHVVLLFLLVCLMIRALSAILSVFCWQNRSVLDYSVLLKTLKYLPDSIFLAMSKWKAFTDDKLKWGSNCYIFLW